MRMALNQLLQMLQLAGYWAVRVCVERERAERSKENRLWHNSHGVIERSSVSFYTFTAAAGKYRDSLASCGDAAIHATMLACAFVGTVVTGVIDRL